MAHEWLLNEEKRSEFETKGAKVTFKHKPNQCTYFNAMYLSLCASEKGKKYYWEFDISGGCTVGVVKKEAFGDGYKISGCFFNGNLTDGSCMLVGGFGDYLGDSQKIGMILDLGETELKIYLIQNDRPLGLAFVQSAPYSSNLHPTISFSGPGSAEIKEKDATNIDKLLVRTDYKNKTIDGKYKLEKVVEKSGEKKMPAYVLSLHGDNKNNDSVSLSIRVINTIGTTATKKGSDGEGDLWSVENLMSTLMAGPPQEMENEGYISAAISEMKRLKFNENFDQVTIVSPNVTLYFKRFLQEKPPHKTSTLLK